ncbi:MAG: universal stress protein [Desulfobacterales bacterium]|nr:universal stress protein [Desulfobacterales bacterium]
MKPNIDTILFSTDLSDSAKYAFGYAVDLAEKYNADIQIVHVLENFSRSSEIQISEVLGPEQWQKLQDEKQEGLKQKIRERVHTFCTAAAPDDTTCELLFTDVHIKRGLAWEEILETAHTLNVDMIIMGTHGYSAIKDALIGGTARKVVRRSKIPVLTVRMP